jgi:type I site-specific restriction-modification system R (restriction) subunit
MVPVSRFLSQLSRNYLFLFVKMLNMTFVIVLIFEECHRYKFGEMREDIAKAFKNYHIFGLTGTPIFKNKC